MLSRHVNGSLKSVTPTTTAVTGSSAPITAVGVEPTSFTATAINTNDITVGNRANTSAQHHWRQVCNSCMP